MQSTGSNTPLELTETSTMTVAKDFTNEPEVYEPLLSREPSEDGAESSSGGRDAGEGRNEPPFSRVVYFIFLLLGVAMLWAWNMFMAAAPYFQGRFESDKWILNHFQPSEVSVSTVGNTAFMFVLSKLQKNASYPKRITSSLILNTVAFTILALSTFIAMSVKIYFTFLLLMVMVASLCAAAIQNGAFSFTSSFGRAEYTQAIMTGQAVAGVLPPLTQIVSVLAVPSKDQKANDASPESTKSAFIYFITASVVSAVTLGAFAYLLRQRSHYEMLRQPGRTTTSEGEILVDAVTDQDARQSSRKTVPLTTLFSKLPYLSLAVMICFAVTMVFPVFTTVIQSVNGVDPALFVPTAFLIWNLGDLLGRMSLLIPSLSLAYHPFAVFCLSMARLIFIPMYLMCNFKGRGAVIGSDFYYLFVVQFLFGLSNGYIGSVCMMGAGDWVAPDEREAAGGFMALCLAGGLAIGSLLSFLLGDL